MLNKGKLSSHWRQAINLTFTFLFFQYLLFLNLSFGMDLRTDLNFILKKEISKNFGNAKVDLIGPLRGAERGLNQEINAVTFLDTDGKGNAHFSLTLDGFSRDSGNSTNYSEVWISFAAWMPAKISLRRIHPGEVLSSDQFITQPVNVANGQAYEYRGLMLPAHMDVNGLEANQTILEGQFLLSTAARRIPDIRRGDSVRIHLVSGGLTLSTLGVAEEPGYLKRQIRVMTNKNKREFSGQLRSGGIVEVRL